MQRQRPGGVQPLVLHRFQHALRRGQHRTVRAHVELGKRHGDDVGEQSFHHVLVVLREARALGQACADPIVLHLIDQKRLFVRHPYPGHAGIGENPARAFRRDQPDDFQSHVLEAMLIHAGEAHVERALSEHEGAGPRFAQIAPGDGVDLRQGDGPFHFLQPRGLTGDIFRTQRLKVGGELLRTRHVGEPVVDRVVNLDQVVGLPALMFECPLGQPGHPIGMVDVDFQDFLGPPHEVEIGVAVQLLGQQETPT